MDGAVPSGCTPYFEDWLAVADREFRVFRCDWGWCVKRGDLAGRSRYLDEAFERVLGHTPATSELRALIDTLDRELTAKHAATGATASRTLDAATLDAA
jgi:hypothetical protein